MRRTQLLSFLGIALFTLAIMAVYHYTQNEEQAPERAENNSESVMVSLTIGEFYDKDNIEVSSGTSALSLLEQIDAEEPALLLETETYEGLGSLVTSLYGLQNGDGERYWQYTVDGEMPQVGAGSYIVKDEEHIVWEFVESSY